MDSKGLIVSSRKESLQHFKQPWAHEHEPVKNLIGAVNVSHELIFNSLDVSFFLINSLLNLLSKQAIKPTVLIGTSGVGQTFTQEVVEAMATNNEVSFLFFLSAKRY